MQNNSLKNNKYVRENIPTVCLSPVDSWPICGESVLVLRDRTRLEFFEVWGVIDPSVPYCDSVSSSAHPSVNEFFGLFDRVEPILFSAGTFHPWQNNYWIKPVLPSRYGHLRYGLPCLDSSIASFTECGFYYPMRSGMLTAPCLGCFDSLAANSGGF